MASYWWPLGHFSVREETKGREPSGTPTTTHSDLPMGSSGHTATAAAAHNNAAAAAVADVRHLAHAAFHTNLESLLVESTKHRSLFLLRDAVQDTRQRQYDPASLFETLCIACTLLAERSAGGTGTSTRKCSSSAAQPHTTSSPATGGTASSSSGAGLYATSSSIEAPHALVTAAETASPPAASAHASSAASPPHALHYRHHAASRALLLQSIGDIGKLIALALLPVTQQVGQRVADLVRQLAFQPSLSPPAQHLLSCSQLPMRAALPHPARVASTASMRPIAPQSHGTTSSTAAAATVSAAGPVQLVHDDPVLVRLIQMTASAASRCPLGCSALAELYSVLFLFYSGVAPQSVLEATCEATLTHHIHTVLTALHNSGAGDDDNVASASGHASGDDPLYHSSPSVTPTASTFTAQLQGVAFIKDVCRLMIGVRTRWLYLSPYGSTSSAPRSAAGGGRGVTVASGSDDSKKGAVAPHRGSIPSSMAGITATVAAATADGGLLWSHDQQQQRQRSSLASTPLLKSLATSSRLTWNALDAQSETAATVAVSGDGDLARVAELPSLSSLPLTVPLRATMEAAPDRLRLFLVRTVTLFFKEHAQALMLPTDATPAPREGESVNGRAIVTSVVAVSMHSPLYAQCLNDCLFSVALWGLHEMGITVLMQPPPALFVEVLQQHRDGSFRPPPCSLELFTCTQQLALASITTHVHSMLTSAQVLLEAHERLLQQLCRRRTPCAASSPSPWLGSNDDLSGGALMSGDDAEQLSQAATVVLSLWRKTLTSASLLWELLQLRSMRSGRRNDSSADAVAAGMSKSTEAYRNSGLYSKGAWWAGRHMSENGYNSDSGDNGDGSGSSTVGASRRSLPSPHGSPAYQQMPALALPRSCGSYLTGSQIAAGGSGDNENHRASTPASPGIADPAVVGEQGGTGVDDASVPSLVRLILSLVELVVSYMQSHAATTMQVSAGDRHIDDRRGGGDGEEAEDVSLTGPLLLSATPPHLLSAEVTEDGFLDELLLKHSALDIGLAAVTAVGPAAAAAAPLCLCTTNASTAYQCFTEVLNCLTTFGQLFSQLVDTQLMPSGAVADKEEVLCRCRACFLTLHPRLLNCEQLCLRHLRYEEDVLPVVLKATGYWVQVSCVLQLPEQRDSYLAALVDVLRTPDPVAGYLVALAPLTALSMSDVTSHTTTMLLEAILKLNDECTATEPVVPGSVAAAALSPSDERDSASLGSKGDAKKSRQHALNIPSWGVGWLGRGRTTSSTRSGAGGSGSWAMFPSQAPMNATAVGARSSIAGPPSRIDAPSPLASASRSKRQSQQPAPASSAIPSGLTSRGWRAPAVQHAVILGVCRLQHKILMMKTLHVIANTLGAQLETGWTLVARGLAVTEPLLYMLRRLLSWIGESVEEQKQREQLLSDALHLRDALRSLCVHNACQLPYSQFDIFFAELVNGTVALEEPAPYAAASGRPPYQDPQSYGDQWVLTSECLSVSVLAMLPFIELRYTDAMSGAAAEDGRDGSDGANRSSVQAIPLQHQRTSALARALRLWELEALFCRYITDHRHVVEWGTKLLTTMVTHKRALLATTASSSVDPAATHPDTSLVSGSLSHDATRTIELVLSTVVSHIATVAVQLCRSASRRRVAAVSSADSVGGSPLGGAGSAASRHAPSTAAPSSSYQVVQSSALVLTSGPFATVPLTQVSNELFGVNAAFGSSLVTSGTKDSLDGTGSSCRLPLLPFVHADTTQSISGLLAAVHRSMQAIAVHTSLDDSNSSVATAPPRTAPVNLDPLEQLLASPFALLDRVYHEWQRQSAGWLRRGGDQDGLSTAAAATAAAEPRELDDLLSLAPVDTDEARELSQKGENPACPGALEAYATSSVIPGTVPKLLANAAATVLMVVVKIVQSYGEDIDGAAWEAILSVLQRTAMVAERHDSLLVGTRGGDPGGGGGITQSNAKNDTVDSSSTSSIGLLRDTSGSKVPNTAFSTEAVESLNTAFRALESIQHNHIPRLKADGLYRLIMCVGTFTVHRVDGGVAGERKLHTNLSAVQLLWSIADYLAAFGGEAFEELECNRVNDNGKGVSVGLVNFTTPGYAGAAAGGVPGSPTRYSNGASAAQQQQDRLWCALLWQLRNGCLDDRQEVRQSSLQTFFALVQTYGWRFSAVCWRFVLQDVLTPLMKVVEVATRLCATPPPSSSLSAQEGDGAAVVTAAAAETSAQDATMQRLLRSFVDRPPQLEEVRVTLFDAGSRLFVTHYAHMQAAAAALSTFSSVQPQHPQLPVTGDDENDATQALEGFLRLCGDVCVVLRGTSGEQAAVAAVHALHGLLVEMPGKGLHAHGVNLAWSALERLLLRGGDDYADESPADMKEGTPPAPYAHTKAKQCTIAVMSATVAAICDSFRLQRLVAAAAPEAADGSTTVTSPSTMERTHSATGLRSYFGGWGGGSSADVAAAAGATSGAELRRRGSSSPAQYFTRLLFLLQAVTRCSAVVNSYYFPSKAQSTLLEGVTAVWPTLSSREARIVWGEVLLPAFPQAEQLQSFVLQQLHKSVPMTGMNDTTTTAAAASAAAAPSTLISLKSAMPPGSHPGYLSAAMEAMRGLMLHHIGADAVGASAAATQTSANATDEDCVRLAFMAPSTVQVTGTLLLLHLAPAAVLGGPSRSGSVPFTIPALFLQECTDLMLYTLWGPILARTPAPPSSPLLSGPSVTTVSAPTTVTVQCRRDGVAALCRVFELLLVTTSTVVRRLNAAPQSGAAAAGGATTAPTTSIMPPHVTAALQSLNLLVDTLGEVVHCVMEQYEDVVCATAAITALSIASTAEGIALSQVAQRSLALLQRWANAVAETSSVRLLSLSSAQTQHHHTRSCSDDRRIISPNAQGAGAHHKVHAQPHSAGHAAATTALTETSRSQLQNVIRASMEARSRAIIAQFVDNPDDTSAGELVIGTLRDMLNIAQIDSRAEPRAGGGAAMPPLSIMMPELLRLVACSSREPNRSVAMIMQEQEMREILANILAMTLSEEKRPPGQAASHEQRGRPENNHPLGSNAKDRY